MWEYGKNGSSNVMGGANSQGERKGEKVGAGFHLVN